MSSANNNNNSLYADLTSIVMSEPVWLCRHCLTKTRMLAVNVSWLLDLVQFGPRQHLPAGSDDQSHTPDTAVQWARDRQ